MPKKLHRCAKKVMKSMKKYGYKGNAWAICNASIHKKSKVKLYGK